MRDLRSYFGLKGIYHSTKDLGFFLGSAAHSRQTKGARVPLTKACTVRGNDVGAPEGPAVRSPRIASRPSMRDASSLSFACRNVAHSWGWSSTSLWSWPGRGLYVREKASLSTTLPTLRPTAPVVGFRMSILKYGSTATMVGRRTRMAVGQAGERATDCRDSGDRGLTRRHDVRVLERRVCGDERRETRDASRGVRWRSPAVAPGFYAVRTPAKHRPQVKAGA